MSSCRGWSGRFSRTANQRRSALTAWSWLTEEESDDLRLNSKIRDSEGVELTIRWIFSQVSKYMNRSMSASSVAHLWCQHNSTLNCKYLNKSHPISPQFLSVLINMETHFHWIWLSTLQEGAQRGGTLVASLGGLHSGVAAFEESLRKLHLQ